MTCTTRGPGDESRFDPAHLTGSAPRGIRRSRSEGINQADRNRQQRRQASQAQLVRSNPNSVLMISPRRVSVYSPAA